VRVVEGYETLPRKDGSFLFALERAATISQAVVVEIDVRVDGVLVREGLPVEFEF
jgi:hypothetical protein